MSDNLQRKLWRYDRLFLDLIHLIEQAERLHKNKMVEALDEIRVELIETAPGGWNVQDALGVTTEASDGN